MGLPTYNLIASTTVGSGGASSIDFTSIPATYTDLVIFASTQSNRNDNIGENIYIRFNGDTGNNYSYRRLTGSGSAAGSDSGTSVSAISWGTTDEQFSSNTNVFGNGILYIPNYAGNTNKSISADGVAERNATTAYMALNAGIWNNTAAITSIKLFPQVGTLWNQYSTAYLYGIKSS